MATLTRQQANALVDQQFRRNIVRTTNWTTRVIQYLYSEIATGDLDESFFYMLPTLNSTIVWGKRQAALESWAYLAQKSVVNGLPFEQERLRAPELASSFTPRGVSTPGFDVTPYMAGADRVATGAPVEYWTSRGPAATKALIKQGAAPDEAVATVMRRTAQVARTEVPLVARTIPAKAAETPSVTGFRRWRRVPGPGACGFCLMLAARGAVYRDPVVAGGQYHANCRCTVEVEVDPKMKDRVSIDPDDLREIEVRVSGTGRVWKEDLGGSWYDYVNRPDRRPPASEFLPRSVGRSAAEAFETRQKAQRPAAGSRNAPPSAVPVTRPGDRSPERKAQIARQLEQLAPRAAAGNEWSLRRQRELMDEYNSFL